jgi:hypothetical protein
MLPIAILGSPLSSKLEASLKVPIANEIACALSARLWEDILEQHHIPYLLLRVADMRMTLSSDSTALSLYEEVSNLKFWNVFRMFTGVMVMKLQATFHDEGLEEWIKHVRVSVIKETERRCMLFLFYCHVF